MTVLLRTKYDISTHRCLGQLPWCPATWQKKTPGFSPQRSVPSSSLDPFTFLFRVQQSHPKEVLSAYIPAAQGPSISPLLALFSGDAVTSTEQVTHQAFLFPYPRRPWGHAPRTSHPCETGMPTCFLRPATILPASLKPSFRDQYKVTSSCCFGATRHLPVFLSFAW